jgi:plastocyanin
VRRQFWGVWVVMSAAIVATMAACGGDGGGGSPTAPGGGGSGGSGSPGPVGATITIQGGRVNPAQVTVSVGQSVNFVNSDGTTRNVSSDPHPIHTDCPQINVVGNLANGQSRATNAFTQARTCGFHNHDDPDNDNFKGRIVIQ